MTWKADLITGTYLKRVEHNEDDGVLSNKFQILFLKDILSCVNNSMVKAAMLRYISYLVICIDNFFSKASSRLVQKILRRE